MYWPTLSACQSIQRWQRCSTHVALILTRNSTASVIGAVGLYTADKQDVDFNSVNHLSVRRSK